MGHTSSIISGMNGKVAVPGFRRGWKKLEKGSLPGCPERLLQGREGGMGGG
jgi:hypothetical protein